MARSPSLALFFDACAKGDVDVLRGLLAKDADLVHAENAERPHRGWTGLHAAAQHGQANAVGLLLEHGADPNAREAGDNTYAMHWAAAGGHLDVVRRLADAGGDVVGDGDEHEVEVIGWATCLDGCHGEVADFLVSRGARHHIFSAIAIGQLDLVRTVVAKNRETLNRRLSRFEQGLTSLHFAISRNRYDILDLLIELGADLEADDRNGQTALAVAMLHGDREAMSRLHAAGAKQPPASGSLNFRESMAKMADSIRKGVPMISVPDIAATLDWYTSIGFNEIGRNEDDGTVNWGMVSFGGADLMLVMHGKPGDHDVSLWFYTNQIDSLYQLFRSKQLQAAQAWLDGAPGNHEGIEFVENLYEPFYGGRQFGIRDLNGYTLYFRQPPER